jgi:THO complex subunit 2
MSWRKFKVFSPIGPSLESLTGTLRHVPPHSFPFYSHTLSATHPSLSLSRKYLIQLHSTPTDPNAVDALVTAYHTLLSATLSLWPPKHPLPPTSFTAFVKSMLHALPSSSQDAPSPAATALGELLIDSMWSIDEQLEEVISDSKTAIAAQSEREKEQVNGRLDESGPILNRDTATKDKGTLLEVVRVLLVRSSVLNGVSRDRAM